MQAWRRVCAVVIGGVLLVCLPAVAELADVHLKSGLRLRGDVRRQGGEYVLRNEAGEVRLSADEVLCVVPVEPATQPADPPASAPADTQPAGAEDETEDPNAAALPEGEQLAPAPLISKDDLQRLRIHELILKGPPENVRVQFERKGRQRDLGVEVLEALRKREHFDPRWEDVLLRGQPTEKLQLILRETGLEHADRIRILTDPEVFDVFRKRVLPTINTSCARSGCHGGASSRVFRFPVGGKSSEAYAYTVYVLLDQMETEHGQMIDRDDPENSGLVRYLLPEETVEHAHPPLKGGPAFKPALRGRDDPLYGTFVRWIQMLSVPRPNYGLEYENPYAGRVGKPANAAAEGEGNP